MRLWALFHLEMSTCTPFTFTHNERNLLCVMSDSTVYYSQYLRDGVTGLCNRNAYSAGVFSVQCSSELQRDRWSV